MRVFALCHLRSLGSPAGLLGAYGLPDGFAGFWVCPIWCEQHWAHGMSKKFKGKDMLHTVDYYYYFLVPNI